MSRTYEQILSTTKKSPTFHLDVDGEDVAWIFVHNVDVKDDVKKICDSYKCRECTSRAKNMIRHEGRYGPMIFYDNDVSDEEVLKNLRDLSLRVCSNVSEVKVSLVTPETYPEINFTNKNSIRNEEEFSHFTIIPDKVSSPSAISRLTPLWNLMMYGIDERLEKFLTEDSRLSIPIILSCIQEIENREIYEHSAEWILKIQERFPKNFSYMTRNEKMELRIFAMMTGRATGSTHFGFSTSQNFISLLTMNSREAVKSTLNDRSSEQNYQRSGLIRQLDRHNVTSKFTVSLVWDGKEFKDDLDLQVVLPDGQICYYGNRNVCGHILDFDAGVSGCEDLPVENISCSGIDDVVIQVNNYQRRTRTKDIHATIFIREVGEEDIIIPIVWPVNRRSGDFMTIRTHIFENNQDSVPQMTDKLASATIAQDKSYQELIGNPTSVVATLSDVDGDVTLLPKMVKVTSASSDFLDMVKNTKKKPLHLSCLQEPKTIEDLVKLLKTGEHNVSIHLPDHSPGYIVNVSTASPTCMKSGKRKTSVSCHYEDKFKLPVLPTRSGTARLDSSWIDCSESSPYGYTNTRVIGIVNKDNKYFLALENSTLPRTNDFPLGGGFYPTDLSSIAHVHRTRWVYNHSTLRPSVPDSSELAIGTFLMGPKATIFLDGRRIVLDVC